MEKATKIGIFDSGVGGITILKEVIKNLPNEDIVYFGDNKNAPYGEKTKDEIINFTIEGVNFLKSKGSKIAIIACNTATAAALESLKDKFNFPILGVIIPGAKLAIKKTKNNKIAVLATPFTCKIEAYSKEIEKLDEKIEVFNIPCKNLCPMIEKGWNNYSNRENILFEYLKEIPNNVKTVILGCTHYPIIKSDVERFLDNHIIIDPAEELVLELKKVLKERELLTTKGEIGSIDFFVSGESYEFKKTAEEFLKIKISEIKKVIL